MSENVLVDYALEASASSKALNFGNLRTALDLIKIYDKIDKVALDEIWRSECLALGVDPHCGAVPVTNFVSIVSKASLLPGITDP
jgi:hypothetical protein